MKKALIICSLCFYLFSCKEVKNNELDYTYEILSLLTNNFVETIVLKPNFPPFIMNENNHTMLVKDSLKAYKHFYEETIREKVIGVTPKLIGIKRGVSFEDSCFVNKDLMNSFNELKETKKINLNKIIVYQEKSILLLKEINDLSTTDIIIQFSRIAFNKEFNNAVIIVNGTYAKLDSVTILYYLEKKNERWYIKCEKGLSIS